MDEGKCQDITSLKNGVVSCTNEASRNSKCNFICYPEYMLVGATTISCSSNLKWNLSEPTCEGIQLNKIKTKSVTR